MMHLFWNRTSRRFPPCGCFGLLSPLREETSEPGFSLLSVEPGNDWESDLTVTSSLPVPGPHSSFCPFSAGSADLEVECRDLEHRTLEPDGVSSNLSSATR